MTFSAVIAAILEVGFPIVCVIAVGWFCWYLVKSSNETAANNMKQVQERCKQREEALMKEIQNNREVNAKAIETIAHYAEKLDRIQADISEIKTDITVIMAKEM